LNTAVYDYQIFCQQKVGGVSRYFCEIASRVGKIAGWRTTVIAPLHYNRYLADSDLRTIGVFLPLPHPRLRRIYTHTNQIVAPILAKVVRRSILHSTYYSDQLKSGKVPKIITVYDMIHELFADSFRPDDPTSRLKRANVEQADRIICISHHTARDMEGILKVPREKIAVTHLSCASIFDEGAIAGDLNICSNGRPYLLYVGERSGYKNFSRFIRAYASSGILAENLDVIAFGGPPLTRTELNEFQQLRLRPDAVKRQIGNDRTLAQHYAKARAFVYPSEYEGFGISPLEAMGCACPVACSSASSIPEVVGAAGEYFDPLSIDSIRTALERVCFDESRRDVLISEGRLQRSRFSWDRCASETLSVYESVL